MHGNIDSWCREELRWGVHILIKMLEWCEPLYDSSKCIWILAGPGGLNRPCIFPTLEMGCGERGMVYLTPHCRSFRCIRKAASSSSSSGAMNSLRGTAHQAFSACLANASLDSSSKSHTAGSQQDIRDVDNFQSGEHGVILVLPINPPPPPRPFCTFNSAVSSLMAATCQPTGIHFLLLCRECGADVEEPGHQRPHGL